MLGKYPIKMCQLKFARGEYRPYLVPMKFYLSFKLLLNLGQAKVGKVWKKQKLWGELFIGVP